MQPKLNHYETEALLEDNEVFGGPEHPAPFTQNMIDFEDAESDDY